MAPLRSRIIPSSVQAAAAAAVAAAFEGLLAAAASGASAPSAAAAPAPSVFVPLPHASVWLLPPPCAGGSPPVGAVLPPLLGPIWQPPLPFQKEKLKRKKIFLINCREDKILLLKASIMSYTEKIKQKPCFG